MLQTTSLLSPHSCWAPAGLLLGSCCTYVAAIGHQRQARTFGRYNLYNTSKMFTGHEQTIMQPHERVPIICHLMDQTKYLLTNGLLEDTDTQHEQINAAKSWLSKAIDLLNDMQTAVRLSTSPRPYRNRMETDGSESTLYLNEHGDWVKHEGIERTPEVKAADQAHCSLLNHWRSQTIKGSKKDASN